MPVDPVTRNIAAERHRRSPRRGLALAPLTIALGLITHVGSTHATGHTSYLVPQGSITQRANATISKSDGVDAYVLPWAVACACAAAAASARGFAQAHQRPRKPASRKA